jgi:hypothetical protein
MRTLLQSSLLVWWLMLGFSIAANAMTIQIDPTQLKENYPSQYVATAQDTIWDISGKFLRTPWGANDMWAQRLKVYPGDKISVIRTGGRSFLQIKHDRTVKLSPHVRVPRGEPAPLEPIPISSIRHFLNKPQVLTQDMIDAAGYVIAESEGRLLMTTGNEIYARNLEYAQVGDRYMALKVGQRYGNSDDEYAVFEAVYLGATEVLDDGDPVTLEITDSENEIRVGNLLVPLEDTRYINDLMPGSPDFIEDAKVIAVVGGVSQIGQYQVLVVNRGTADGLREGHVLTVFAGGNIVKDTVRPDYEGGEDIVLPKRNAGTILVFKSFDTVSYALVMEATRAIRVNYEVGLP